MKQYQWKWKAYWSKVSAILLSSGSCGINQVLPPLAKKGGSCLWLGRKGLAIIAHPTGVVSRFLAFMLGLAGILTHG